MDLRDWLIAAGIVLVLVIAVDGIRRMRNRSKLKLNIDKEFENFPDIDFSSELPTGGARAASSSAGANVTADEEVDLLMDDSFKGVSKGISQNIKASKDTDKQAPSTPERPSSILSAKTAAHFKYQQQPRPEVEPTGTTIINEAVMDISSSEEGGRIEPSFAGADIDLLDEVSGASEASSLERAIIEDKVLEAAALTAETDDVGVSATEEGSRFSNSDDELISPVRVRTVVSTSKDQTDLSKPPLSVVNERSPSYSENDYDFNKPITELMGDRIPGSPLVELDNAKPADDDMLFGATEEPILEESLEKLEPASLVAEARNKEADEKPKTKKRAKKKKSSRMQRWKEEIQTSFFDIDPGLDPIQQKEQADQTEEKAEKSSSPSNTKTPESNVEAAEPQVLALSVTARETFSGVKLFKLVEACGMEFGEMDIFHRFEDDKGEGAIQFSMVNGVKPGSFDLSQREVFSTPAVSFFLQMGEPADLMNAFECMLATAQCVADNLKGEVKDENHSVMRPQTIEHYRQQIRDFERRRLTRRA